MRYQKAPTSELTELSLGLMLNVRTAILNQAVYSGILSFVVTNAKALPGKHVKILIVVVIE